MADDNRSFLKTMPLSGRKNNLTLSDISEIKKCPVIRMELRVAASKIIGANATVICGITIGRYAFVGAGAAVNKNVPDYALAAGNPARQIGWVCECGERLADDLKCSYCGKSYEKAENSLCKIKRI